MRPAPLIPPTTDTLRVRPWPDPVIDSLGHDPRSAYVEAFWLGILGPSTVWLLRAIARGLEAEPATARSLGLGDGSGRHSPFVRALARTVQFELAVLDGDGMLAVRRKLPPLNRRQVERLPDHLRAAHQSWQEDQLDRDGVERLRVRSRRLALSLLELGEDLEETERQLLRWRFHPAMARESSAWAWNRHLAATGGEPLDEAPGTPATAIASAGSPNPSEPVDAA